MESTKNPNLTLEDKFNELNENYQKLSLRIQAIEAQKHNEIEKKRVDEIGWMHQSGIIDAEEKQRRIENNWGWDLFAPKFTPTKGANFIKAPEASPGGTQASVAQPSSP